MIEDNDLHGKLYCAALRATGFVPFHIADPRAALSGILKDSVAAVVIDIRLPAADGRDIIRQVRDERPLGRLPILAVSAFSDQDMEDSCIAAGADRFRAKPMPLSVLTQDVGELIGARGG